MSYKSEFQANNVDLQGLIDTVKTLPVARNDALFLEEKNSELGTGSWSGISYGNEKFVVIEDNSDKCLYSNNGFTWLQNSMPVKSYWRNVGYYNDKFIAFSTNNSNIAYSFDGVTWEKSGLPWSGYDSVPCAYGNGKYVALHPGTTSRDDRAAYSSDGITWTSITVPVAAKWNSLIYGNGKFVGIGCYYASFTASALDSYIYSTDGVTWNSSTLPTSAIWRKAMYYNNKFIALAESGIGAYSTDGVNWTEITTPISKVMGIACGDNACVAISYNSNFVAYSTDGINWKESTLPTSAQWYSVTYGKGKFVAVAYDLTTAAISYNGIDWFFEDTLIVDVNDNDVTEETVLATGALDDALFLSEKDIYITDVILDEQEVSNHASIINNSSLPCFSSTETYIITVDGVDYVCNGYSAEDSSLCVGDSRLYLSGDLSNPVDMPFCIVSWFNDSSFGSGLEVGQYLDFYFADGGTHVVSIGLLTDTEKEKVIVDINDNDITEEIIETIGAESEEIGDIKITARTDLDDNWMLCDGTQISREVYSELGGIIPSSLTDVWTQKTIWEGTEKYTYINCINYVNGYWVVGGQYYDGSKCYARLAYATSLTGTWTVQDLWSGSIAHTSASFSDTIFCIDYINGYWVVGGQYYYSSTHRAKFAYATSLNGTWTTKELWTGSSNQGYDNVNIRKIIYANNTWVAVGNYDASTPAARIAYTSDLTGSWSTYTPSLRGIESIIYENGRWIIVGSYYSSYYYGRIAYSSTLNSGWTYVNLWGGSGASTGNNGCRDIIYANGYYVVVGHAYTSDSYITRIAYTTDPTGAWTTKDIWVSSDSFDGDIRRIKFANNYWIICGPHSENGVNCARFAYATSLEDDWNIKDVWNTASSSIFTNSSYVTDINYLNDEWVLSGTNGDKKAVVAYVDKNLITLPTLSFDGVNSYIKIKG